jgi:hypothetical protein
MNIPVSGVERILVGTQPRDEHAEVGDVRAKRLRRESCRLPLDKECVNERLNVSLTYAKPRCRTSSTGTRLPLTTVVGHALDVLSASTARSRLLFLCAFTIHNRSPPIVGADMKSVSQSDPAS